MYCLIAPTRPVFRWVVGGIPDNDDDDDDGEADLGVLMMWVVMVGVVEPTWPRRSDDEASLGVLMMWVVLVGVVEPTWP